MNNTLVNRIIYLAHTNPDKLAIAFKKETLSYKELLLRIAGIAEQLKKENISLGDRICFTALSKPEMVVTYLGIQLCGGVAVFLDKNGTPENMALTYHESGAKLLLTDKPMKDFSAGIEIRSLREVYQNSDCIDTIENIKEICPNSDTFAEILFTTGTTGNPKGVVLSYKSVYNILSNTIEGLGIRENDTMLIPLPLNHSLALRILRAVLYQGATVVLQNGFTFAKEVENNIIQYHCNSMVCVPSSFEVMRSQMQDSFSSILGKMRFIEFGAGSLTIKQRREITSLLPNTTIFNTWGSSESGGAIFCNVSEAVKDENIIGALGKPLNGKVEIKVLNSQGQEIESNIANPGRMAIKGDMQMAGYWNNPEATAKTLVNGWLLTGDMVYVQNGYVFMLGRADDIINVGGEKVSPIEVENIAGQYEYIKECACIGVTDPDGILGQIPVLFVVVKNGYSDELLLKFLSTKMERYKFPRQFFKIASLPRNRMQKINRAELHKMWNERDVYDLLNPVMQNIISRRSIRRFTNQEIPRPILEMIIKAGYYAPSGHNMQSWRFTILTKPDDILRLKENARVAALKNKVNFYGFENPKVLILISNDIRNVNGCQDASCAAENMMLAANSYGLGSVWLNPLVTLRNVEPLKNLLDEFLIPKNHTVWATIALGYPVSEGVVLAKKTDVAYYI